jgi:hypothetical protein
MAVTINIPSQVKSYANLAAFPATGSLKTIYIAEDTNKTYRWTGSVYVEISASAATGLSVGTTPIASGTIGRVLFQGTGNVLQQSSSLFWDNTNVRLGVGTATPQRNLHINEPTTGLVFLQLSNATSGATTSDGLQIYGDGTNFVYGNFENGYCAFLTNATEKLRITNGGNVLINTTTDAGFRLDVNGTARVQGNATVSLNQNAATSITISNTTSGASAQSAFTATSNGGSFGLGKASSAYTTYKIIALNDGFIYNGTSGDISILNDVPNGRIKFATNQSNTAQMTLFNTGNFGINTTTDAGFRLDVNGTARVISTLTSDTDIFRVTNGSSANVLRVKANGDFLMGGSTDMGATNGLGIFMRYNLRVGSLSLADASAVLQADSTTKGFLPPRMTTTQRNAIASPAAGLIVYDTTLNLPHFYNGTIWVSL